MSGYNNVIIIYLISALPRESLLYRECTQVHFGIESGKQLSLANRNILYKLFVDLASMDDSKLLVSLSQEQSSTSEFWLYAVLGIDNPFSLITLGSADLNTGSKFCLLCDHNASITKQLSNFSSFTDCHR